MDEQMIADIAKAIDDALPQRVCLADESLTFVATAAHSVIAGKVVELTEAGVALDRLLRMTVPVPAGCVAPEGSPMTPEFRVSVQLVTDEGVHFIVHAHGHSSDTLDLVATKRGMVLLAPFEPGESQSERIAHSAALAPHPKARNEPGREPARDVADDEWEEWMREQDLRAIGESRARDSRGTDHG